MATLLNEFYPKTNKGRAIYIKEIYCSKCRNQIYKAGVIWSNEENKAIAKAIKCCHCGRVRRIDYDQFTYTEIPYNKNVCHVKHKACEHATSYGVCLLSNAYDCQPIDTTAEEIEMRLRYANEDDSE